MGLHLVLHCTLGINSLKAQDYPMLDGYRFSLLNQCFPRAQFYLFRKLRSCLAGTRAALGLRCGHSGNSFCKTRKSMFWGQRGTSEAWPSASAVPPREKETFSRWLSFSPPSPRPLSGRTSVTCNWSRHVGLGRIKASVMTWGLPFCTGQVRGPSGPNPVCGFASSCREPGLAFLPRGRQHECAHSGVLCGVFK